MIDTGSSEMLRTRVETPQRWRAQEEWFDRQPRICVWRFCGTGQGKKRHVIIIRISPCALLYIYSSDSDKNGVLYPVRLKVHTTAYVPWGWIWGHHARDTRSVVTFISVRSKRHIRNLPLQRASISSSVPGGHALAETKPFYP